MNLVVPPPTWMSVNGRKKVEWCPSRVRENFYLYINNWVAYIKKSWIETLREETHDPYVNVYSFPEKNTSDVRPPPSLYYLFCFLYLLFILKSMTIHDILSPLTHFSLTFSEHTPLVLVLRKLLSYDRSRRALVVKPWSLLLFSSPFGVFLDLLL